MIVSLKVPDELYEVYAKRNPRDPRAAMAEALEAWKDREPGIPRLVVENPELRELQRLTQSELSQPKQLVDWAKRTVSVAVAGIEFELSLGQRQRLEAEAAALKQPFNAYLLQQLKLVVGRGLGV